MTAHVRGTCAVCGRNCSTRIPKGGDGSQRNPYRHRSLTKPGLCNGHLRATVETDIRNQR